MKSEGILKDLLVVELASVLAGPATGMFLAELGARVIKVEHFKSGGDVTRTWKLAGEKEETDISAYFSSVNWGKESVGVDLREEEGKQVIIELVRKADIVLASFKPGDAEKLEMDGKTLLGLNPRLIYADLSAYGAADPRTGFDAIIQAEAGFTFMNGDPNSGPTKMPVALMDLLAAHQLKEGILLALYRRALSGEGGCVSTSLIHAGLASLANQAANWLVAGHIPQRMGSEHPNIVPYGTLFYTSDGKPLVIAVGNDRQFGALCRCLGLEGLAEDVRFRENPGRVRNREVLREILAEKMGLESRKVLLERFLSAQVPVGAVNDMQEVFEQEWARRSILEGGGMKGLRTVALEPEADFIRKEMRRPPHLCEDTGTVLHEILGYSFEKISTLKAAGIIG